MTLLEFARGPALEWSIAIFVLGILLRLLGSLLLARTVPLSKPRSTNTVWAGVRTVFRRMYTHRGFRAGTKFQFWSGYVFHIGLFIVIFLYIPHISFFESLLGISWPGLPNSIVMAAGVLTLGIGVALLYRRLTDPVLRMLSGFDDYFSWFVTFVPVLTGLMAFGHVGLRYETMLAVHILSVELLLIWFPFGKLMHTFFFVPSRAQNGAKFERRGVRA